MVMNDDLAKVKSATNHDDMEPKTCYEGTRPEYVAQTFFLLYITIATITGNSAICCSIYYNQTLHRFSNYLVMSLALSDLMVAFFSLPMRIHQSLHNTHCMVPRRNHLCFLDLGRFSLPLHLFCELSINIAGPFCSDKISVEVSPYYNSEKRSLDDSLYLVSWRRDSFTRTKQLDKSYHSSVCYR